MTSKSTSISVCDLGCGLLLCHHFLYHTSVGYLIQMAYRMLTKLVNRSSSIICQRRSGTDENGISINKKTNNNTFILRVSEQNQSTIVELCAFSVDNLLTPLSTLLIMYC